MKLDDLKDGMVVVLRNEEPYIVSRNCAFHSNVLAGYKNFYELWNTQIDFNRYNEDMTFKGKNMELFDIMRIYEESRDSIPFSKGKLLWQREEYKEVTMKEIEEKFGCKVKIVGGEKMKYKLSQTKTVTKEIELLPCPFCGSENIKPIHYDGELGYRHSKDYVICCSCGATGGNVEDSDIERAIEKWNHREN